jgi:hypothetical protein
MKRVWDRRYKEFDKGVDKKLNRFQGEFTTGLRNIWASYAEENKKELMKDWVYMGVQGDKVAAKYISHLF